MRTGFYFKYGNKDIFYETSAKNKTQRLASRILRALALPDNPGTRREVLYYLCPATLDVRTLPNGRRYNEISGSGFGGAGHFCDEDLDIIIKED